MQTIGFDRATIARWVSFATTARSAAFVAESRTDRHAILTFDAGVPRGLRTHTHVGMPFGIFREFTAYAAKRPDLSGWVLRAQKADGIIVSITAEPAGIPGA